MCRHPTFTESLAWTLSTHDRILTHDETIKNLHLKFTFHSKCANNQCWQENELNDNNSTHSDSHTWMKWNSRNIYGKCGVWEAMLSLGLKTCAHIIWYTIQLDWLTFFYRHHRHPRILIQFQWSWKSRWTGGDDNNENNISYAHLNPVCCA